MTETSLALDSEPARYPLSFTQEWFVTLDQGDDGGTFGSRFFLVTAMRITGQVDVAVLRGALDDVVARHELLRTLVIRDATITDQPRRHRSLNVTTRGLHIHPAALSRRPRTRPRQPRPQHLLNLDH